MTIREFIDNYNDKKNEDVNIKSYISSAEKIRLAKTVMDSSVEYDRGFIKFDSYKKHITFIFEVIEAHTDLRFSDDWADKMQEYDMLCENELIDVIVDPFIKDYYASLEILNMMCDDVLMENSIEASIAKLVQCVTENLDVFVGALTDKLGDVDVEKIIPKDLDLNKLQGFLGKFK